jgi:hypothetical protein
MGKNGACGSSNHLNCPVLSFDFFGSSHVVCQGDPLSLFLFVLVMEVFSKILGAVTSRG